MMYFRIVNDVIVSGPIELPSTWTNPIDGAVYDMTVTSPIELIDLGWYQLVPDATIMRDPYDTIDTQTYTINGTTVDEVITLHPITLQDVIAQKIRIIGEYQDTWMGGTFNWNGKTWWGDEPSRQNITGITSAIANGVPIPAGFTWTDSNSSPVVMTASDLVAMGATMLTWVNTCYKTKYYHVGNIMAMTDQNQIIAYDHTLGWPS